MNKYELTVWNELSDRERLLSLMLDKLSWLLAEDRAKEADTICKTIKLMFPKIKDVVMASSMFDGLWKAKRYSEAVRIYQKADRPFWRSQEVGKYYEGQGLIKKAMAEYERLVEEYLKMKILPLPRGPVELFKLGKWYVEKNPSKAKKYLKLYLRAEKEDSGTGFGIQYKKEALSLLKRHKWKG
jgi:tetratricopeptide (TPR) repeat protein